LGVGDRVWRTEGDGGMYSGRFSGGGTHVCFGGGTKPVGGGKSSYIGSTGLCSGFVGDLFTGTWGVGWVEGVAVGEAFARDVGRGLGDETGMGSL